MAVVTIPDEKRTLREPAEIQEYLAAIGIQYERWEADQPISDDATAQQVLDAYSSQIEILKTQGGYVTADVIDVNPNTPNLDTMLAKFSSEHWHDEDEVRYIVAGPWRLSHPSARPRRRRHRSRSRRPHSRPARNPSLVRSLH